MFISLAQMERKLYFKETSKLDALIVPMHFELKDLVTASGQAELLNKRFKQDANLWWQLLGTVSKPLALR